MQALVPIHSRLVKEAAQNWKRPDIFGVLLASYALLLRSSPVSVTSPRALTATPSQGFDVRKTSRECLEVPSELKAFTFARSALIPALLGSSTFEKQTSSDTVCDTAEFLLSTLARFASNYVRVLSNSGDWPISREKWEQDAQENLRLRRSHQEQQRQFHASFGTMESHPSETVPSGVDLLQRPDCLDDVIAFAVAVSSLGPEHAQTFWSIDSGAASGSGSILSPSEALIKLDELRQEDESLLPSYLSFLASLALADGASELIHRMLSCAPEDGRISWISLMETFRWYTNQLTSSDYGPAATMKTASTSRASTSYYYAGEENLADSSSDLNGPSSGSSLKNTPMARDLGEASSFALMSQLRLFSNVCRNCPSAKPFLLAMTIPAQSASLTVSNETDSTLSILFSLAVSPLPPAVRGAVFTALSELLQAHPSDDFFSKAQESASKAWQLVDQSQILPIYLLDQFPSVLDKDPKSFVGLSFPPSSTSLVSLSECF